MKENYRNNNKTSAKKVEILISQKNNKRLKIRQVASVVKRNKCEYPTGIEPVTFRTPVGRSNH